MTLKELMEDGIYLLFLLQNNNAPKGANELNAHVDRFLAQFEKNARNFNKPDAAVLDVKYAFCALLDEAILSSNYDLRDGWGRNPLQLRLFNDHVAGERFFDKLETLRMDPVANIEVLEVFHTCLLLGFQGKYLLDSSEKLSFLISRLQQEITHARGKEEFAPNWKLPHRLQQYVRHELPLWMFFALLAFVGMTVFLAYLWLLDHDTIRLQENQSIPAQNHPAEKVKFSS